jgi:hypothetical protein
MNRTAWRRARVALDVATFVAAAWWWLRPAAAPAHDEDHVLPCARYVAGDGSDQAAREHAVKVCEDAWREVKEAERGQP